MIVNLPHSKFRHVYAIVRFDLPMDQDNPENTCTVVKVLSSETAAQKEIARLSDLNKNKKCRYKIQLTRLVP